MVTNIKKYMAFLLLLLTTNNITSAAKITHDDEEDIQEIVNNYTDVELTPEEIDLLKFARIGNVEEFKKLVETGKVNINCVKQIDCKCCQEDNHSKNCSDICFCQYTPLMLAVQFGHIEIVKYLLEQENIVVNYYSEAGQVDDDHAHWDFNAAYLAMEFKNYDILKLILEHKKFRILVSGNEEDDKKEEASSLYERFLNLIDLGLHDHVKMLISRLENKINDEFFMEDDPGNFEFTLLASCAYYSDEKSLILLKYLLESNFLNPNKMVDYHHLYVKMHLTTPLIIAARCDGKKKFEFIKSLTTHPDIVLNTKDGQGNTALHWLYHYNNFEIIQYLLTLDGIDPEIKNSDGLSIEDLAKKDNNEMVLKFLSEYNKKEKKVVKLEISTDSENSDKSSPKVKQEELDQIDPEISDILKKEEITDEKPSKSVSILIGPAIETINQEEFRSISPSFYLGLVSTTLYNNITTDTPKMIKEEKEKKSEEPESFGLKKRRIE